MPTLDQHQSSDIVRMINMGESGAGKSGALASLVIAGYHLWLLDFDNGVDIIVSALREHYKSDPDGLQAAFQRVHYETLRDTITSANGVPKVKSPVSAWKNAGKTLAAWGADSFTPADIVVMDTLSTASRAALYEALSLAGRLNQRPQLQDYGWLADSVLLFMDMLTTDDNHFNLIINTHIKYFGGDDETQILARGLPNAVGQQISKDIGKYFNTAVLTRTKGSGPAAKRIISTKPQGVVEVKTSNPFGVKSEYSVETGMAELFADILGHGPPPREVVA